jgi:hypothetical protein
MSTARASVTNDKIIEKQTASPVATPIRLTIVSIRYRRMIEAAGKLDASMVVIIFVTFAALASS